MWVDFEATGSAVWCRSRLWRDWAQTARAKAVAGPDFDLGAYISPAVAIRYIGLHGPHLGGERRVEPHFLHRIARHADIPDADSNVW